MGENKNLNQKDVAKIVKNFPLQPRFNNVIITLNKLVSDNELELSENIMNDVQFVVAKGNMVKDLEVGQQVLIDLERMTVMANVETEQGYQQVPQIKIDPVKVGDQVFAFLDDRYVKSIDNR